MTERQLQLFHAKNLKLHATTSHEEVHKFTNFTTDFIRYETVFHQATRTGDSVCPFVGLYWRKKHGRCAAVQLIRVRCLSRVVSRIKRRNTRIRIRLNLI